MHATCPSNHYSDSILHYETKFYNFIFYLILYFPQIQSINQYLIHVYLQRGLDGTLSEFELGQALWRCSDVNVLCVRSMAVISTLCSCFFLWRVTFRSGEDQCLIVTNYCLFQLEGTEQGNEMGWYDPRFFFTASVICWHSRALRLFYLFRHFL